jgi:protein-disulfide isomerase
VIYEDFLCPFCGELESETREELAQLAEDGKVYVEYRPFDLLGSEQTDYYSVAAANAFKVVLDASGAEVAKTFHDELYEDQPSEAGPFPDADWLVEKAVDAGAAEADVRPGIEDQTQKDWVEQATQAAADAGVGSTPTILLDGEVYAEGRTIATIAANLLDALDEA